ncbi:MAG: hypothetical protein LQ349_006297 [Xanthoria aureola]|nr:MAG: hypothetical protein LQ349_006297 [Xanthoria aureola]
MAPGLVTKHAPSQKPSDEGGSSLVVEQPDTTGEPENELPLVGGQKGQFKPPSAHPDQRSTGVRSLSNGSERSNTSPQPKLANSFRMVIHLRGEGIAQRVACLDTASGFDAISDGVVDSLHLDTEEYIGEPAVPLGPTKNSYMPEKQVTLDWHVATFHKTNTTTFVVFDEDHSHGFDILLGLATIGKLGFLTRNKKVYWVSAGREVCLSE